MYLLLAVLTLFPSLVSTGCATSNSVSSSSPSNAGVSWTAPADCNQLTATLAGGGGGNGLGGGGSGMSLTITHDFTAGANNVFLYWVGGGGSGIPSLSYKGGGGGGSASALYSNPLGRVLAIAGGGGGGGIVGSYSTYGSLGGDAGLSSGSKGSGMASGGGGGQSYAANFGNYYSTVASGGKGYVGASGTGATMSTASTQAGGDGWGNRNAAGGLGYARGGYGGYTIAGLGGGGGGGGYWGGGGGSAQQCCYSNGCSGGGGSSYYDATYTALASTGTGGAGAPHYYNSQQAVYTWVAGVNGQAGWVSLSCTRCVLTCSAGSYGAPTATSCASCDSGCGCAAGSTASCPQQCAPGTASAGGEGWPCPACYAGTYAPGSGSTSCTDCSAGTTSAAGATSCTPVIPPSPGPSLCYKYAAITATDSWSAQQTACANLGSGWNLASVVDDGTLADVVVSATCGGAFASETYYYTGMYDPYSGTARGMSTGNRAYPYWQWVSGASNAYFLLNQGGSIWASIDGIYPQPDNWWGGECCGHTQGATGLNDVECAQRKAACCQAVQSCSSTPTASPSISFSVSISGSVTPSVMASVSMTPTYTAAATVTGTVFPSITISSSQTPLSSASMSATPSLSVSPPSSSSLSASVPASSTPSSTASLSASKSLSASLSPSISSSRVSSPSSTMMPSSSGSVSSSTSLSSSSSPSLSFSLSSTLSASISASVDPSISASPTISPSRTLSSTLSGSFSPSLSPSPTFSFSTSQSPAATQLSYSLFPNRMLILMSLSGGTAQNFLSSPTLGVQLRACLADIMVIDLSALQIASLETMPGGSPIYIYPDNAMNAGAGAVRFLGSAVDDHLLLDLRGVAGREAASASGGVSVIFALDVAATSVVYIYGNGNSNVNAVCSSISRQLPVLVAYAISHLAGSARCSEFSDSWTNQTGILSTSSFSLEYLTRRDPSLNMTTTIAITNDNASSDSILSTPTTIAIFAGGIFVSILFLLIMYCAYRRFRRCLRAPTAITLARWGASDADYTLPRDSQRQFFVIFSPSGASKIPVIFESSNESILAVIDKRQGICAAKKVGRAFITVSSEDKGLSTKALVRVIPAVHSARTMSWDDLDPVGTEEPRPGGFGDVFRALKVANGGSNYDVAVKIARGNPSENSDVMNKLIEEGDKLSSAAFAGENQRIVYFHGLVRGRPSQKWHDKVNQKHLGILGGIDSSNEVVGLVTRWEPNGSLSDRLHEKGVRWHLSTEERLLLLVQIAEGVAQLHAMMPDFIVHGDLKSDNVLLSEFMEPRITDFGLSKVRDAAVRATSSSYSSSGLRVGGTWKYMAPEMTGANTKPASKATDVYALATLSWEVLSGRDPWVSEGHDVFSRLDKLRSGGNLSLASESVKGPMPSDLPSIARDIIERAAAFDSEVRPSASEMYDALKIAYERMARQKFDVFLSHKWDGKGSAAKPAPVTNLVLNELQYNGVRARVWHDTKHMGQDSKRSMKEGIERSDVVVALISKSYASSPACMLELQHASDLGKKIICALVEPSLGTAKEWVPSENDGSPEERTMARLIKAKDFLWADLRKLPEVLQPNTRAADNLRAINPAAMPTLVKFVKEALASLQKPTSPKAKRLTLPHSKANSVISANDTEQGFSSTHPARTVNPLLTSWGKSDQIGIVSHPHCPPTLPDALNSNSSSEPRAI